ncbi:hypothetical protein H0N95_00405, partial [Candidatus Micrarchaeota archaeon]|nr:hypothetical protein [Candidatus Micrarchaeota archaeon]
MNEQKQVLIIVGLLLALGLASIYLSWLFESRGVASDFTFYKSEIAVNGNIINEKLYYSPNEGYRDLFRNFISPVVPSGSPGSNAIVISDVECQQGDAYYYGKYGAFCTFSGTVDCDKTQLQYFDFVEPNEYGCTKKGITKSETFFYPGNNYWIQATYNFIPENLFESNGSYYLKFVAYSPGRHPAMVRGENLIVTGNVLMKNEFSANENVVLYLPVDKNDYSGAGILPLDFSKGEGTSFLSYLLNVRTILALLPSALFYLIWLFLGKERVDPQLPKILTEYPKKRKGWEVALYFNTPFLRTGKEFFSSMLL